MGGVGDCSGGIGAIFTGFVLIPSSIVPARLPAEWRLQVLRRSLDASYSGDYTDIPGILGN